MKIITSLLLCLALVACGGGDEHEDECFDTTKSYSETHERHGRMVAEKTCPAPYN